MHYFFALREGIDVTDVRQLVSFRKALSVNLTNDEIPRLTSARCCKGAGVLNAVEIAVRDKLCAVVTDYASSVQGGGTGFAGRLLSVLHCIIHQVGSY